MNSRKNHITPRQTSNCNLHFFRPPSKLLFYEALPGTPTVTKLNPHYRTVYKHDLIFVPEYQLLGPVPLHKACAGTGSHTVAARNLVVRLCIEVAQRNVVISNSTLNASARKRKEAKNSFTAIKQLENCLQPRITTNQFSGVGYETAQTKRGPFKTDRKAKKATGRQYSRRLHLQLNLLRVTSSKIVFFLQSAGGEAMNENKFLNTDSSTGSVETTIKPLPFKDPNFIHSGIGGAAAGKKNRTWKNLKQILASERALPWQLNDPSYFNIDAPPSFKPAKKYSDISGLPANYTDPQSKLRFSTIEEFAYIRMLPSDVVTGYLALRKATSIVS
ncbi:INO80 complex subunit C [Athene cunicularia]|uniref:INO80 complex subunit C n=1 Tax=Athene cunicularia TaxID=194338 RepID=UPI000EF64F28|nr:INO80 complex subunit C [Athene cunicularia]